ncbi:MAG: Arc family DNA-binding protein [Marinifilaceae bacterium]
MAKEKKSFMLRINKEILDAVEKWADDEFRSLNGQLEWIITNALKKDKRFPKKAKGESDKE